MKYFQIYVAALNFAEHPVKLPLTDLPNNEKLQKSTVNISTPTILYFPIPDCDSDF